MAGSFLLATQFLVAGGLLALAAWLLYLKFGSVVHRSFALFLLLTSITTTINALRDLRDYAGATDVLLLHLREYALLALVPVLFYFVLQYRRPATADLRWRWLLAGVWALQIVLPLLYLWDHSLATHCPVDCEATAGREAGPLAVVSFGLPLATACAAMVLLRSAGTQSGARWKPTMLLAGALLVHAVIRPAITLGVLQVTGWSGLVSSYAASAWVHAANVVVLLALPVALLGLVRLHALAAGDAVALAIAHRIAWLAAVAALVGWGVGGSLYFGIDPTWALFVVGLLGMLIPFLIVYALVRHRLFGMDIKLRFTIKYSTIAGVFMAVFWVASTAAQEFLAEAYGWAIGGAAAGLLLFAINPLLRLGERMSTVALPHTRPLAHMSHQDRLRLFGDQAELVWMDGVMGLRERRILDQLRERLGLSAEEALRLESAAAAAAQRGIGHAPMRKLHVEEAG